MMNNTQENSLEGTQSLEIKKEIMIFIWVSFFRALTRMISFLSQLKKRIELRMSKLMLNEMLPDNM